MKDWLTPDWDTLMRVAAPDYLYVEQDGTLAGKSVGSAPGEWLNEGTFVIEHNGKWFFTYSPYGYGNPGYSVHVAVADNPFGPFIKMKGAYSPVIILASMSFFTLSHRFAFVKNCSFPSFFINLLSLRA